MDAVTLILKTMQVGLSVWDQKLKTRYARQALELERKRNEIIDERPLDRNKLDHIERDIMQLYSSTLVEISG